MSRDLAVYARKQKAIPPDEIVAQMRARGVPVEWRSDPLAEFIAKSSRKGSWRAGYVVPEGETNAEGGISISTKALAKGVAQRLADDFGEVLTEAQREALLEAKRDYRLSVGWLPEANRERILRCLIDVLADLGDGLILDMQTDRFYDRAEYRNQ